MEIPQLETHKVKPSTPNQPIMIIEKYYLNMIQSLDDWQLMDEIRRQEYIIDDITQGLMASQDNGSFGPDCHGLYYSWYRLRALLGEQESRISERLNEREKQTHERNGVAQ